MNDDDHTSIVLDDRSVCLCDVGQSAYIAATIISPDGAQRLVLAEREAIGDPGTRFDPTCSTVAHEQPGPLPMEFVRRFTIGQRTHRCGRRTCKGCPCRNRVDRPGQACEWHSEAAR